MAAGRRASYVPYTPARLVNRHARADHWFWTCYSAYPQPQYQALYPPDVGRPQAPAVISSGHALARRVRALCEQYGLRDRLPRPIIPGAKRALNQRMAEALANTAYTLEITDAPDRQVWDYRKAAWAVDELPQELGLFCQQLGAAGLAQLPGLAPRLGPEVAVLAETLKAAGTPAA